MKNLFLIFFFFPAIALAEVDSQLGFGLGTQYGGFVGFKYSIRSDSNTFYAGLGLADPTDEEYGFTLGWEKNLAEKHAFGFLVRTKESKSFTGVVYLSDPSVTPSRKIILKDGYESFFAGTYTYYFNRFDEPGFSIGVSAGKSYFNRNLKDGFGDDIEYGAHFGYQF
ncbi:hypothetical protein [Microbulbifer spongiae]|uniref:Acyloxyacyl hydrolase n=1 Tax=Microbulbifer spongiae TaxID=2944933 RepID=A0ABY9EAB9_9GAMM|nr:hypothetical protein [Microbulbifer sp. MI-G]WKD49405.1 hypothetical protein M8T91_16120 [Microbulbifer sp. MI-G]